MSVKVIADNTPEGLEITKAIEQKKLQNILCHSFIIRWGNWVDDMPGRIVFNTPQAIKNTLDKENLIKTLMKSHVRCPQILKPDLMTNFPVLGRKYNQPGDSYLRLIDNINECKSCDCDFFIEYLDIVHEYQAHVMDLNIFYIEEKYCKVIELQDEPVIRNCSSEWKLRRIDLSCLLQSESESIEELAIRAVQSLGLDFGVVNIAKANTGLYYVLDINPTCKHMTNDCKDAYIAQFTETLIKYNDLLSSNHDITIGADVECVIKDINTGTLVYASDFFTEDGPAGLDSRSIEAGKKHFPILELRPDCSTNPLEVVDSIQSIMDDISGHINYSNIGLYAGSMPLYNYWIGGHIHFGTRPNSKLLKSLDNYLALPVMMIEKAHTARNRKSKYGELGNFRLKSHGFEYRSLGSWIISPEIARGVLCLSKVIIMEYLNLSEEFLISFYDINAYYSVNKTFFMSKLKSIIYNIYSTATFKSYRSYIEPLFNMITDCEEWNEDEAINKSWNMTPNGSSFNYLEKCFIPKRKRDELGIELEKKISIKIGAKNYTLAVYPKDDFSIEKNSLVSFSSDICANAGLRETDEVDLWFESQSNSIKAGPVLGILTDLEPNESEPFGIQSYYFKRLIKLSKCKGMIAFIFTIYDIDWDNERINGNTYDFNKSYWITQYFPIPDVIYDRGSLVNRKKYGQYAAKFAINVKKMKIKFINSLECINLLNDRWKTFLLLKSNNGFKKYLLQSFKLQKEEQIEGYLRRYNNLSIKPRAINKDECIISVRKTTDNNYEIIQKNLHADEIVYEGNFSIVVQTINNILNDLEYLKTNLIIQCVPVLAKYKSRDLQIHVVMQKNSMGMWLISCIVLRYWGRYGEFINIANESGLSYTETLRASFGNRTEEVLGKIKKASKNIIFFIESKGLLVGDIAIDFAIDENLNIFITELSPKPDNLLSSMGSFKIRNLAVNRTLEYARFLVCKKPKRV